MKIVIVEDHLMFREVLRKVCTRDLRHTVVGESADGRVAVDLVIQLMPDLVLLDLHLPNLDGFGVVDVLKQTVPLVKILILSSHCDDYTVFRAEKARVHGFVDKNTNTVETLKEAITEIAHGRTYYSESFLQLKMARYKDPHSFDKLLTRREQSILTLVGESLTDLEIAVRLEISAETVAKHRFNVLRKLGLQTTAELMRYARTHGFTLSARPGEPGSLLP